MAAPRVLVTRPGERARQLVASLAATGAAPELLKVMRLEALPETPEQRSHWLNIDEFRRVVVVSPSAAECLAEALDRYWPQLPIGVDFYAVGAATAAILHERLGVRVHVPSAGQGLNRHDAGETHQAQGDTSEALLALPSLQVLNEQKVLVVAGEGGRPLLADTLAARGARLTRLAVYRRVLLTPEASMQQRLATGDYAALVVSSGEILEHLAGWCQPAALNQPLIVSSQRLATLAGSLGFANCRVAAGATPVALAAEVARACHLDGADVDHDDLEKG
ncbi:MULTISPECIES: uroporphyrinogen-III synthase [Halomonadaceae]|uniref:uroporphyrinogen-III synthase n=1 Tax=Halomonadaceae TaxID=28256 RepID=UPI0015837892|nr:MULTISPECIES: uroporphyrinogen-III synthase [Halomonas]MDI4636552.1 uroporphyrinogen-III synthase [Halomonas sp. BMC7]NUJ60917.1 uroporphyrinogen-III synthase [Halomonas taeanensis]